MTQSFRVVNKLPGTFLLEVNSDSGSFSPAILILVKGIGRHVGDFSDRERWWTGLPQPRRGGQHHQAPEVDRSHVSEDILVEISNSLVQTFGTDRALEPGRSSFLSPYIVSPAPCSLPLLEYTRIPRSYLTKTN